MEFLVIPGLHLEIGYFNKTFKVTEKICPEIRKWFEACHIVRPQEHNNDFEGGMINKMLDKIDILKG